ncbi:tRNA (adenosine(37)-N6)-threonylcarbamoyltransferase complex dimerization subunit type 1 TsaB [bacterium]|nr:tRNA (adenosine(37)-N6)-threonylcarbamoyltransferase complex dimerization subunit type 1 TsaB [bacterium]
MTTRFLVIQGSYQKTATAVFDGHSICASIAEQSVMASARLVPMIDEVIGKSGIDFNAIDFIAVDQGPGAFTSLRVSITTANALGYSKKIPLIGVDGIDALKNEVISSIEKESVLVVLFNAYNSEVFYGLYKSCGTLLETKGYEKIASLVERLGKMECGNFVFAGNGALMHKSKILDVLKEAKVMDVDQASISTIASMAFDKKDSEKQFKLSPLYLKTQKFAIRRPAIKACD